MKCKTCKPQKEFLYTLFRNMTDEQEESFTVSDKDGFEWSTATNAKGALYGALACGIQLNDINFNGIYIKGLNDVRARAYGGR